MLPVSGAEQLNASDAHKIRPISSAQNAYWRLLRPGPVEREAVVDRRGAVARRHEQVPQPGGAGLVLQFLDHRQHFPALALALLRVIVGDARADVAHP